MMLVRRFALSLQLFVSVFTISGATQAEQLDGTVVGVSDGDTITVLDANKNQTKTI